MKQKAIILSIIIFILGCNENGEWKSKLSNEINELKTVKLQKKYLIDIRNLDQEVRRFETEILKKYGHESQEYKASLKKMMETDELNLLKIEMYLNKYGHPKITMHGEQASGTPRLVIHHAVGGLKPRMRNFEYIYNAYQNGDIDDGAITFYLNRMYSIKYGKRIKWNRSYNVEEELDTLYKSLNLESVVKEINSKKNE